MTIIVGDMMESFNKKTFRVSISNFIRAKI